MSKLSSIVVARPPSKTRIGVYQPSTAPASSKAPTPGMSPLSPADALVAFLDLVRAWEMPSDRAWRMLTGGSKPRPILTEDQAGRVAHLVAIDAGMRKIGNKPVGEWMVQKNPAPFFGNTVPADYLTRRGLPGYVDLQRQVRRWASM